MGREKERGGKGRDKEDKWGEKRSKGRKSGKGGFGRGDHNSYNPPSKTLPASIATKRTTIQCLALSHSL
jgi:hypothetical protein